MFSGGLLVRLDAGEPADEAEHGAGLVEKAVLLRRVVLVREEHVLRARPHQRQQLLTLIDPLEEVLVAVLEEAERVERVVVLREVLPICG